MPFSSLNRLSRLSLRYVTGITSLRHDDAWVTSFPKAGNTWVRFLLCNLLSLSELDGRTVDFPFLDTTMPALGYSDLRHPWPYQSIPRFIKTHQKYRAGLFSRPGRAVYVLRDPRDAMVSYFHFLRSSTVRPYDGEFKDFIRHDVFGLRAYIKHYLSWQSHSTIVVRYDHLQQDAVAALRRILAACAISAREELIHLAVERSDFRQVRAVQQKSGLTEPDSFRPGYVFARSGKTGQWPEYFTRADEAYYQTICDACGFDEYR